MASLYVVCSHANRTSWVVSWSAAVLNQVDRYEYSSDPWVHICKATTSASVEYHKMKTFKFSKIVRKISVKIMVTYNNALLVHKHYRKS